MDHSTMCLEGLEVPVVQVNTVVIGTGSAGYCAADRLAQFGQDDVLVVADKVNAGTSRNAGSDKQTYYKPTLSGNGPDSVGAMARTLFDGGAMDGDIALVEAAMSARCFYNLVEAGVEFPSDRYGQFSGYKTDHDPRQRATSAGPFTSQSMVEHLEQRVRSHHTPIFGAIRLVDLLVDRSGETPRCVGLLGLRRDVAIGQGCPFILIAARNVVLATGGPAGMFADSVWPHGQWGAMGAALRAGAVGHNLPEFQFGLSSLRPRWNVSGTYMQVVPSFVSVDPDGTEHAYLSEVINDPGALTSLVFRKGYQWPFDVDKVRDGSSFIDILTYRETVMRGRRVFLDFRVNQPGWDPHRLDDEARRYLKSAGVFDLPSPVERLRHMNLPAYELYLNRNPGIDLASKRLEIGVCAQHNNGGIDVNAWWRSSIDGLYVVGEAAGAHGVARPGGAALNSAQVGATRAAQWIAAHESGEMPIDDTWWALATATLTAAVDLLDGACFRKGADASPIDSIMAVSTRAMSDHAGLVRSRQGLEDLQGRIDRWRRQLVNECCVDPSNRRSVDRLFLVRDILDAQAVYVAAMIDYLDHGVGSRGSVLYTDPDGALPVSWWSDGSQLDVEEIFRHRLDSRQHHGVTQRVWLAPDGHEYGIQWDPVRPIPGEDEFFENVWRGYRKDHNIH